VLRDALQSAAVHRINAANPETADVAAMADHILANAELSMSDWGARRKIGTPLIEEEGADLPIEITPRDPSVFNDAVRDKITGDVVWNDLRDLLHEGRYADQEENKIKAGNAKGCIKRFLYDAEAGDAVVINTEYGHFIAVLIGPARYNPEAPVTDIEPNHVFQRDIRFVTDEDDDPIPFRASDLPNALQPNQLSMTTLDRDQIKSLLRTEQALNALASVDSLADN